MDFENVYEDTRRAEAYAKLEFPGTYFLAYRDLHVTGNKALDFGCGTGRSSRYLEKLGFATIGIDISDDMLRQARERDKEGDYRLVTEGDLRQFDGESFDLVLSAFTFDNIPTADKKLRNFRQIKDHLGPVHRVEEHRQLFLQEVLERFGGLLDLLVPVLEGNPVLQQQFVLDELVEHLETVALLHEGVMDVVALHVGLVLVLGAIRIEAHDIRGFDKRLQDDG